MVMVELSLVKIDDHPEFDSRGNLFTPLIPSESVYAAALGLKSVE